MWIVLTATTTARTTQHISSATLESFSNSNTPNSPKKSNFIASKVFLGIRGGHASSSVQKFDSDPSDFSPDSDIRNSTDKQPMGQQADPTSKTYPSARPRFHYVENFFFSLFNNFLTDLDVLHICTKVASWIFWTFTLLSILGTAGVDTKPLLSLLGISGITLGFSLKDILANINAGLFVLFTRPFSRGSVINVNGFKGEVISMDMRYVRLYSAVEKTTILVPLSMVYCNAIKIEDPHVRRERS